MFQLTDKKALVVGGSRGLGRTIALAYADAGADVAIASRTPEQLEEVAQLIRAKNRRAFIFEMDVTDSESVAKMVDAVRAEFGRIDILVNSAGIAWVERADSMSDGTWKLMIDTNLTGTFYCCREALRVMIEQKSGCIINLASVAGTRAIPGLSGYAATKGGIIMFTKATALENIRHSVRVNALAPGYFRTDMNIATLDDPQAGPKLLQLIPMRRAGEPEEISGLAVYLASDEASYVTGEVFYISGGMTAQ